MSGQYIAILQTDHWQEHVTPTYVLPLILILSGPVVWMHALCNTNGSSTKQAQDGNATAVSAARL